jgi:cytidyltransferase-like protein
VREIIFPNVEELGAHLPPRKRFALVGGAFDLIHVGHIHLLEYAAGLESLLIVCVLTDASIRRYKANDRPIVPQEQRARMVASVKGVDFVYFSDHGPSSVETLSFLQPHSVVFGEESTNAETIARWQERIAVHSPKTTVHILPRYTEAPVSTSEIVSRIRKV